MDKQIHLYAISDITQTRIDVTKGDESFTGQRTLPVEIGPFKDTLHINLTSDCVEDKLVTAFLHLGGDLWMYLAVGGFGKSIYVCDGSLVGLSPETVKTFGGKSSVDTLTKLKPGITAIYKAENNVVWKRLDDSTLYRELPVA